MIENYVYSNTFEIKSLRDNNKQLFINFMKPHQSPHLQ